MVEKGFFRRVFVPLSILLVGLLGFGLGRLDGAGQRPPIEIRYEPELVSTSTPAAQSAQTPKDSAVDTVYASSRGTRYYYMHCKSTISEKNKITFSNAAAAEAAGYTLAAGCKR